jgi:hypothetical protein
MLFLLILVESFSKDLLDNLKSRSFSQVSSIKTLDFSTPQNTEQECGLLLTLIDWCLTSSEQLFSYIQNENI